MRLTSRMDYNALILRYIDQTYYDSFDGQEGPVHALDSANPDLCGAQAPANTEGHFGNMP